VFYLPLQRSQKEEVTSKMGGGGCVSYRNFYRAFEVCTHMVFKLVGLVEYVQKNSSNLTGGGTDRCQMNKYSGLSDYYSEFLQVIFC
jgi:hypothetical protein